MYKAGGIQASLRCMWLMSCHPGHRHNYPAQATLRSSQGDDKLEICPKWKSLKLIMVSFQSSASVPVAVPNVGMAHRLGPRLGQALPLHSTPSPDSHFCPPWPAHLVIGVAVSGREQVRPIPGVPGLPILLLRSKLEQEPTHFVNHQKDKREKKPALVSGQGF